MRSKPMFWLVLTGVLGVCAIMLAVAHSAKAGGGPSGRIIARSQFRRTADPSPEGAKGTLLLIQDGPKQTFRVQITDLAEENLSVQLCTNSFYDNTNSPVFYVSPVNRTGSRQGNWYRKLVGTTGAPVEFQLLGVDNLSDMSNLRSIDIANPCCTNIVGGTNFYECVQIVTNGETVLSCTTNVLGGLTNIYVNSFVWAPIPTLAANPSVFSFHAKTPMQRPPIAAPSPNATGSITVSYSGSSGRSLLDVRIANMTKGQTYGLWLSDGGTNFASGAFELLANGAAAKFRRDTQNGDPLPIQVSSVADLTGRVFQVQDAFGIVHLQGVFP